MPKFDEPSGTYLYSKASESIRSNAMIASQLDVFGIFDAGQPTTDKTVWDSEKQKHPAAGEEPKATYERGKFYFHAFIVGDKLVFSGRDVFRRYLARQG
jgi:hypothetical protein